MLNQFAVGIPTLPSRPVSFPPHPIPGGMLSRSFGVPSRRSKVCRGRDAFVAPDHARATWRACDEKKTTKKRR